MGNGRVALVRGAGTRTDIFAFAIGETAPQAQEDLPNDNERLADFRQVVDDTTGKCWWQVLCHWFKIVLEEYEREKFPPYAPASLIFKLALHSISCPELWKKAKKKD